MKSIFVLLVLSLAWIPVNGQDFTKQKEVAQGVIKHFEGGETNQIYALFDSTMRASITADKLNEIWKSLPSQFGNYLGSGDAVTFEAQGMKVINTFMDFEKADLDLRLAFNEKNEISGLFFLPAQKRK